MGWRKKSKKVEVPKRLTEYSAKNKKCLLTELLTKIEMIENDCCVHEDPSAKRQQDVASTKDDFLRTKGEIYLDMERCRQSIRDRHNVLRSKGNNIESIQLNSQINSLLRALNTKYNNIAIIYKKQCRSYQKMNISKEELENRYNDLNLLKRQIHDLRTDARHLSQGGHAQSDAGNYRTLTDMRTEKLNRIQEENARRGLNLPAYYNDDSSGPVEPDPEVNERVSEWMRRDEEVDKEVMRIGEAIDRICDISIRIGEKTEKQKVIATELQTKTDEASAELVVVNNKLKHFMRKQNNTTFCIKIFLGSLLLVLILSVIFLVKARLKK